ncbi:MAG: hypothetical protein Q8784_01750 [Vigna little leaf phytoplasma]|nr:hypothetical protein [Vigna little leaf phytoplasma]
MMQIKRKLYFLPLFLLSFVGVLCLLNINPVMAMNNNNNLPGNNLVVNNTDEYSIFRNLLFRQSEKTQQMINALVNNAEEAEINALLNHLQDIHQQIITYQQRQLDNQELMLRNLDNHITRIQLEREYLLLIQEIMLIINNMPLHASEDQINNLRNVQSRIDQNQRQMNIIINQIQNYSNQLNNRTRRN